MWFSAKLLFESYVNDGKDLSPLYEESIILIDTDTEDCAAIKAEKFGKKKEHEYKNESGDTVIWHFIKVIEIQDLCESSVYDGIEVFSHMYRKEPDSTEIISRVG